jgi:hypothetical protein
MIAVGNGRGFVVNSRLDRLVITAGHCLPSLPSCNSAPSLTYSALLGPVGVKSTVPAFCHFVDPVSGIAVLGSPGIEWPDRAKYDELTSASTPLSIAVPPERSLVWVPSLDGRWFSHVAAHTAAYDKGTLVIYDSDEIVSEMFGMPIVADDGSAIGIVCDELMREWSQSFHPQLVEELPRWLLRMLRVQKLPPVFQCYQ